MQNINIGKSGIQVPFLGMGTWAIGGGSWWGDNDDALSVKAIQTAVEQGIQWIDTAPIYGLYHSETVVGEAMKHIDRDKVVLSTKCGLEWRHETPVLHKVVDGTTVYRDLSAKSIIEDVEDSLRRLHTDHLDVLLLHRPDALMEPDEVAEAFTALESSGKVRYFGVSNFNSRQLELLQSSLKQKILVNQLQLSIMHTGMIDHALRTNTDFCHAEDRDGEILDYCRLKGITIQAWSPFQYGFFEGVFVDNEKFPELNKTLAELSEKYGISKTALCVAWIQRHPARIQTIVGTTNPKRLQDICTAGHVRLSREDWYKIYLSAGNELP